MVKITKEEKEVIMSIFPEVKIIRPKKQKSRRKVYYCDENPKVKELLDSMRHQEEEYVRSENKNSRSRRRGGKKRWN